MLVSFNQSNPLDLGGGTSVSSNDLWAIGSTIQVEPAFTVRPAGYSGPFVRRKILGRWPYDMWVIPLRTDRSRHEVSPRGGPPEDDSGI